MEHDIEFARMSGRGSPLQRPDAGGSPVGATATPAGAFPSSAHFSAHPEPVEGEPVEGEPVEGSHSGAPRVPEPAGGNQAPPVAPPPAGLASFAGLSGDALASVAQCRWQQIHTHGHTAQKDRQLPQGYLANIAGRYLQAAREDIQFNKPAARYRAHLVKAAAAVLAEIDRLDAAPPAPADEWDAQP